MDGASEAARAPPLPKIIDYPVTIGLAVDVLLVIVLLGAARRLDPSQGALTIGLMVAVGFLGLVIYSSLFTVPADEETAAIIGGLTAAFGAVVAFWLRPK